MVSDPFTVDELPEVYPIIEPFIERLYRDFCGYSPSEVKRLLMKRAATLHAVGNEGFFIAQWEHDKCHVLAAAAMSGHISDLSEVISATTSYVKQLGCSKITFTSSRTGWSKVAVRQGFHVETVTYAKEF